MFSGVLADLTNVNDSDVAPEGDYAVNVAEAEVKNTRAGTGTYLQVKLEIEGGPCAGMKITDRFNLTNPNPVAVRLGLQGLKRLLKAAGKTDFVLRSPTELCGLKMSAKVGIRAGEGGYEDSNEVKKYKAIAKQDTAFDNSGFIDASGGDEELPF